MVKLIDKRYHYVYLLTYKKAFYIGSRSCYCSPGEDTQYLSSSKLIKHLIASGIQFAKTIIGIYDTQEEAFRIEQETINKVITQKNCINLAANGYSQLDANQVNKMDHLSRLFSVCLNAWSKYLKCKLHNKKQKELKKMRKKLK